MTQIMQISISVSEILAFTALMFSIVGAWVTLRVRIQKLETTTNLKIVEIERQILEAKSSNTDWVHDMKDTINRFLVDNKEEHRTIGTNIEGIKNSIEGINIRLAKQSTP